MLNLLYENKNNQEDEATNNETNNQPSDTLLIIQDYLYRADLIQQLKSLQTTADKYSNKIPELSKISYIIDKLLPLTKYLTTEELQTIYNELYQNTSNIISKQNMKEVNDNESIRANTSIK